MSNTEKNHDSKGENSNNKNQNISESSTLGLYSKNAGEYYSKPSEVAVVLKKIFNATQLKKEVASSKADK